LFAGGSLVHGTLRRRPTWFCPRTEAVRGFDTQVGEVTVLLNSPRHLPKDFVLTVWAVTLAVIAVIWVVLPAFDSDCPSPCDGYAYAGLARGRCLHRGKARMGAPGWAPQITRIGLRSMGSTSSEAHSFGYNLTARAEREKTQGE
jgi:hypothetical protein